MGLEQAVKDHHDYIYGRKFTVFTDHRPLTYVFAEGAMNKHIACYLDTLMSYDFDVVYIPGETNVLPDSLSRMRDVKVSAEERAEYKSTDLDKEIPNSVKDFTFLHTLSELQTLKVNWRNPFENKDDASVEVKENGEVLKVEDVQRKIDSEEIKTIDVDSKVDGYEQEVKLCLLRYKNIIEGIENLDINGDEEDPLRLCGLSLRSGNISTEVHEFAPGIKEKLDSLHTVGHYGLRHMLGQLRLQREGWKGMNMDIREYLRTCITCAKWNLGEQVFHELRSVVAQLPWDHIQLDYITSFDESQPILNEVDGYKYILVIVDIFTGFTVLKPCKTREAGECVKALWEVFSIMGVPKILQSDGDKSFVSALMKNLCDVLDMQKLVTHSYSHRELGKAESMVKIVSKCLRTLMTDNGDSWLDLLPIANNIAINATIKELTGLSPYVMMFNRPVGIFEGYKMPEEGDDISLEMKNKWIKHQTDVLEQLFPSTRDRINAMKNRYKESFAKNHKIAKSTLPLGAKVMLKELLETNKNIANYHSIFKVIKVNDDLTYDIEDGAKTIICGRPIDHLKVLPINDDLLNEVYLIEKLVDAKKSDDDKWMYKVRYLGYDSDEDRWVFQKEVSDAMIKDYWANTRILNRKRNSENKGNDIVNVDNIVKEVAVKKIKNNILKDVKEKENLLTKESVATKEVVIEEPKVTKAGRFIKKTTKEKLRVLNKRN